MKYSQEKAPRNGYALSANDNVLIIHDPDGLECRRCDEKCHRNEPSRTGVHQLRHSQINEQYLYRTATIITN